MGETYTDRIMDDLRAAYSRIDELERFVGSIRHAKQLFDDGYEAEGRAQLDASIAHLDRDLPNSTG